MKPFLYLFTSRTFMACSSDHHQQQHSRAPRRPRAPVSKSLSQSTPSLLNLGCHINSHRKGRRTRSLPDLTATRGSGKQQQHPVTGTKTYTVAPCALRSRKASGQASTCTHFIPKTAKIESLSRRHPPTSPAQQNTTSYSRLLYHTSIILFTSCQRRAFVLHGGKHAGKETLGMPCSSDASHHSWLKCLRKQGLASPGPW